MTLTQRKVFDAIVAYLQEYGCSPSFADIGKGAGLTSLSTVSKHLDGLELSGYISFMVNLSNRKSRSIALTQAGAELAGIGEQFTLAQLRSQIDLKNHRIAELEHDLREIRSDLKAWEEEENGKESQRHQRVSAQAAGR